MANGQTKLNYEDTDGIDWSWLRLECISINVAVPPNRKRHQVAFFLAFSHDENLHCNSH